MDYKKLYKEALERAKELQHDNCWVTSIFPELKESEDEKMREMAIKAVYAPEAQSCIKSWGINPDDVITWLERQGEQKPTEKVEPKFKVGDIIRHKEQGFTCKIIAIDTEYRLSECNGGFGNIIVCDTHWHKHRQYKELSKSKFKEILIKYGSK